MLNKIKVELESISDSDKYLFFGKNMRGRVSYIRKRCSQTKNKYLKFHVPKQ